MMNTDELCKTSGTKHGFDTSKVFNLNTKYPYYIKGEGDEFFEYVDRNKDLSEYHDSNYESISSQFYMEHSA